MIRRILIAVIFLGGNQILYSQVNDDNNREFTIPTENIIWYDNFNNGDISKWTVIDQVPDEPSSWHTERGYLIENSNMGNSKKMLGTHIIAGDSTWKDYCIKTNIIGTDDDFIGVIFRYINKDNYYCFIHSSQRRVTMLAKRVSGVYSILDEYKSKDAYCQFTLMISSLHDTLKVYLDDEKILEASDTDLDRGKVGFLSCDNVGLYVDYIQVYSEYDIVHKEKHNLINRGPYVQSVLDDKATIIWGTNFPSNSIVEYGLSVEGRMEVSSNEVTTNHEIHLTDLMPETNYFYRIRSDSLVGNWNTFKSAINSDTPFRFIAYGDTQLDFLRHRDIVKQISKHDFDLIVHVGDVVQCGPRENWNVEFFDPLSNILKNKPVYVSIGNHQLNGEYFYDYFSFPEQTHENYYSIEYGNSYFIFLDNRRAAYPDKLFYPEISKGSAQYNWLESQLSSKEAQEAEWLFVVAHVPSFVNNSQEYFGDCKNYLVPLFEKYSVDISFSGHVHGYDRGEVKNVNYVVTGGGGGHLDKKKSRMITAESKFQLIYNYCLVNIDANRLIFKAYDIDGEMIDQFEITK